MLRQRLRHAHTPEALAEIYAKPHDHTHWEDHVERVAQTIAFAREYLGPIRTVADLSCGSGAIASGLGADRVILGDLAPGYEYHGPMEETLEAIPHVDAFVCCETVEHLDNPDAVLAQIRAKSDRLILSTPVGAWNEGNVEHYWAWSEVGVGQMLTAAGWAIDSFVRLPVVSYYRWCVWGCS